MLQPSELEVRFERGVPVKKQKTNFWLGKFQVQMKHTIGCQHSNVASL